MGSAEQVPILRSVTATGVIVPARFALGTSAAVVRSVPMLLFDLETEDGVTGRSYLFCYTPAGARAVAAIAAEAVEIARGQPADPLGLAQFWGRRYALLGLTGAVRMALSAIDIAIWDALATARSTPLATLLGAAPRKIPAYDSRGLGLMAPDRLAGEAEALAASGLSALKLRLGHATLAEDMAALRAVRDRIPADVAIMVDYNQALTKAEALKRGRALETAGVAWIEEPIRHDDYAGTAALARALDLPVQIGENFNGPEAMATAIEAGASDYVMPDVGRIGGVTGWLQAAALAKAHGIEMSSHLMPEISAHLLAATPTAHWLEYVDWADAILEEPLVIEAGAAVVPDRPGLGLAWDKEKLKRLATA